MIALVYRSQNDPFEAALACTLAQAVAEKTGSALLFTDKLPRLKGVFSVPLTTFHLCIGDTIRPVDVYQAEKNSVRIFIIDYAQPVVFAAALTATVATLVNEAGQKPRYLHLFGAEDVFAALLCKRYFHIPFVYSHRQYKEIKLPKRDLQILGLSLPQYSPGFGEIFYPEQLAGLEASYVINEYGGILPHDWNCLLASFTGKLIQGKPVVDTAYWEGISLHRTERKQALMVSRNQAGNILVVYDVTITINEETVPPEVVMIPLDKDNVKQKEQLLAADFYLFDSEAGLPKQLLFALAAGCIPVAAQSGFVSHVLTAVEDAPGSAAGYLFRRGETWQNALAAATRDFREKAEWQASLQERNKSWVAKQFGLGQAADLYCRVYDGMGPVRLPFVAASNAITAGSGTEEF